MTAASRHDPARSRLIWKLGLFVIFGLLCGVSAAILYCLDGKRRGFPVVRSTGFVTYTWKFGPTAVFTIALAFWRQIDYEVKIRAPWEEMATGYTDASKSMLLDYLSPILPTAFFRAVRNRHWGVVVSTLIFTFIKFATLFSTGLLVLQPVDMIETKTIRLETRDSTPLAQSVHSFQSIVNEYVAGTQLKLPRLKGTSDVAAFQEVSGINDGLPPRAIISGEVLAVYPWLHCETGSSYSWFETDYNPLFENSSIETRYIKIPTYRVTTYLHYETEHAKATMTMQAPLCQHDAVTCPESIITGQVDAAYFMGDDDVEEGWPDAIRIVVYEVASQKGPVDESDLVLGTTTSNTTIFPGVEWKQYISWASVLLCKVDYAIETGTSITQWPLSNGSSSSAKISTNTTHSYRTFPEYQASNLTSGIIKLVTLTKGYTAAVLKEGSKTSNTFLDLMLAAGNSSQLSSFQNPLSMVEPAKFVFQGLGSIYLKPWATFPDHAFTNATVEFSSIKLRISRLPFWLMESCLFCFCLGLVVLIRHFQITKLPFRTIGLFHDAVIVGSSTQAFTFLDRYEGPLNEGALVELSHDMSFHIDSSPLGAPRIESAYTACHELPKSRCSRRPIKSSDWSMHSTGWWYIILSIVLSGLIIVVLELIQQRTDLSGGGFVVTISRSRATNLSSFVPALVMLLVSMLYDGPGFIVAGLAPYLLLYRGPTPLRQLRTNPLRQLPPVSIAHQLGARQLGVALVMMAALLGSTLNIIASGLYSVKDYTEVYDGFADTIDAFDLAANLSLRRAGAATFAAIQRTNASFPLGTGDEFAFPLFAVSTSHNRTPVGDVNGSWGSVQIDMPVLRMSLNCTEIPSSELTLDLDGNKPFPLKHEARQSFANVTSRGPLPAHCRYRSPVYRDSDEYVVESTPYLWLGLYEKQQTGAEVERVQAVVNGSIVSSSTDPVGYPPRCPSVAFTIGSWRSGSPGAGNFTRAVCSEYMEIIPATLTFTMPERELDRTRPPILHEERASVIDNLNWSFTDLFYQESDADHGDADALDAFYSNVVHGVQGVPLTEMIDHDNYGHFLDVTQHLYRVYMAQVIGNDMRVVSNDLSSDYLPLPIGTRFNATIASTKGIRIQQDHRVKLALQVILGVMAAFLLLGSRDIRQCDTLLVCNPFHILGRTSLLIHSEFVRQLDLGKSETELRQQYADVKLRLWRCAKVGDRTQVITVATPVCKESVQKNHPNFVPKRPVSETKSWEEEPLRLERPVSDVRWKPSPAPPRYEELEPPWTVHRRGKEIARPTTDVEEEQLPVHGIDSGTIRKRNRWHTGIDFA